jgi:beta-galactosidase
MFDFAADARNQGGEPGMNHKGMVTFDRKLKKDVFYLYKAYWNKEDKFVHIASKRYEYRSVKKQIITVYSNLDEVSLYHNGKLVETKKGDKVYKFQIELEDNENTIEVKSGDYMDKCTVYKVDEEKKEYYLTKGDSSNWM